MLRTCVALTLYGFPITLKPLVFQFLRQPFPRFTPSSSLHPAGVMLTSSRGPSVGSPIYFESMLHSLAYLFLTQFAVLRTTYGKPFVRKMCSMACIMQTMCSCYICAVLATDPIKAFIIQVKVEFQVSHKFTFLRKCRTFIDLFVFLMTI